MDNYIFKSYADVKAWIDDNQLVTYRFRQGRGLSDKAENNWIFIYNDDQSPQENLRTLERRLDAHAGMHLTGVGFRTAKATVGGLVCEVEYGHKSDYYDQFKGMIGTPAPAIDAEKLERDLTEKLELKFKLQRLEDERANFERERKEYESEKQSAIGAIIGYFAPIAQAWMQKQGLARVAGQDVEAERIVPAPEQPEAEEERAPELPDDEAQKGYDLLVRFKAVEPDYLRLLESVVTMAENGDRMYGTAKSFLLKQW